MMYWMLRWYLGCKVGTMSDVMLVFSGCSIGVMLDVRLVLVGT